MAKQNAYLAKREADRKLASEITQRWTAQLCLDVMTIVLNDPAVMGKDVCSALRDFRRLARHSMRNTESGS